MILLEDVLKCKNGLIFISTVKWWESSDINGFNGWKNWHQNKNKKQKEQKKAQKRKKYHNEI